MMASTVADNASTTPTPLSANPSRNQRCLRAQAAMIASAYSYSRSTGIRKLSHHQSRKRRMKEHLAGFCGSMPFAAQRIVISAAYGVGIVAHGGLGRRAKAPARPKRSVPDRQEGFGRPLAAGNIGRRIGHRAGTALTITGGPSCPKACIESHRKGSPQASTCPVGIGDAGVGMSDENPVFPWGSAIQYN